MHICMYLYHMHLCVHVCIHAQLPILFSSRLRKMKFISSPIASARLRKMKFISSPIASAVTSFLHVYLSIYTCVRCVSACVYTHMFVCVYMHMCISVCMCASSRWRQDHTIAEGDHSNTLFTRRWYVLLCWKEFPTTGSASIVVLRQWRVTLHSSSDRLTKRQRVNRVLFDPGSGTNCSPHPLGLSASLVDG